MLDLLSPASPERLRLDLTTRCNLRCVYCALSQSTWQGVDMPADLVRHAIEAILDLSSHREVREIHVNGHGETTFLEGWDKVCRPLVEAGLPVAMTTNLAKSYSTEELEVLARMRVIAISIDTADLDLLKRLRRKVDLRQLITNIQMIRATGLRLEAHPVRFEFSCGLYDQNSLVIEDLARLAVTLGIRSVGFWNLATWHHDEFPYEYTDVPVSDRAFPLDNLAREELLPRLDAIRRAIAILNSNGVETQINGNFIETLTSQCKAPSATEAPAVDGLALPPNMTRDCVDPWVYAEIDTNGDVKPCCARESVGNLRSANLHDIRNGEAIRRLRSNLLEGTLDRDCAACPLKAPIEPRYLQEQVQELLLGPKPVTQLSTEPNFTKSGNLLHFALEHLKAGQKSIAWLELSGALAIDPGIEVDVANESTILIHLERILAEAKSPATLSTLAGICRELGDRKTALLLLKRYVEIAPEAPDREHALADIAKESPSPSAEASQPETWVKLRHAVRFRTRLKSLLGG